MISAIKFIDRAVKKTLTAFCATLLLMMVAFTVYSVVMRYVFKNPPIWGDLLTVLSNIWLVFFALALTVRDKDHIALDLIYNWLPRKVAFCIQQFWTAVIFCLGLVMIIWGLEAVSTMGGNTGRCGISHGRTAVSCSSRTICPRNTRSPSFRYRVSWFAWPRLPQSQRTVCG